MEAIPQGAEALTPSGPRDLPAAPPAAPHKQHGTTQLIYRDPAATKQAAMATHGPPASPREGPAHSQSLRR